MAFHKNFPPDNWKPHIKNSHYQTGAFKMRYNFVKLLSCSISLTFSSWIKLIYDKITQIYRVKKEFNPNWEIQNNRNSALQNSPFQKLLFQNGSFRSGRFVKPRFHFPELHKLSFMTKLHTVTKNHSGTFAVFRCKMSIFRRVKHQVNVM